MEQTEKLFKDNLNNYNESKKLLKQINKRFNTNYKGFVLIGNDLKLFGNTKE